MITKRKIKIPIFNYLMIVIIFDNWDDLQTHISKEIFDIPSKGVTIDYDTYCVICCSPKHKSTLVHESGHIKNLIWKYIGYTPQRDNDEVDQYLQTYIYEEIVKVMNKHLTI